MNTANPLLAILCPKKPFVWLAVISFVSSTVFSQDLENRTGYIDHLYEFSKISSVTGREQDAASFLKTLLPNAVLETDKLGNLILEIGSGEPRILLTTPLDEPGYVINQIQDDGYLRVAPVGYGHNGRLFHQFLQGHEVQISTPKGSVTGVSTIPSTHFEGLRTERERSKGPFMWQEAFIDVGASTRQEVNNSNIQLLDPLTLHKKPAVIGNKFLAAPSVRSKAAAIALAAVANSIDQGKIKGTLVIAWTTLELINGKGLEAVINQYGPFDEIHRFNRFLDSEQAGTNKLLSNRSLPKTNISYSTARPTASFRSSASTIDYKSYNVYEVGLPALYADTPVEMMAIADFELLINHWLQLTGSQTTLTPFQKLASKPDPQSYFSFVEQQDLISEFIGAYGVSGDEEEVRALVLKKMPPWAKPEVDGKGNVVLTFGQGTEHIVFVAHMDETGYIVDSIQADGRLILRSRGGMLPWIWEAQPALVHAKTGKINGVFEPRPDYKSAERRFSRIPLSINAGFSSAKEAIANGIEVGITAVTMPKKMVRLSENRAAARGFDDRVGCASLILALKNLDPGSLGRKITFVWSVEEEVGLGGASYAAANLKDAEVVYPIDTYVSSDDPYTSEFWSNCPLGNGAVIRVLESINFVSRENLERLQSLAAQKDIKVQYGMTAGGTDGQPFLGYGIPSVPLSWPGRYSHSPVEVMDFRDVKSLVSLIQAIIKE